MSIDKEQANERLAAIEAEAAKLREIINREDAPKPKRGEVWKDAHCSPEILTDHGWVYLGRNSAGKSSIGLLGGRCATRLGTFDEVFIEREKVKEVIERAFAAEDYDGETLRDNFGLCNSGIGKVAKILKELL